MAMEKMEGETQLQVEKAITFALMKEGGNTALTSSWKEQREMGNLQSASLVQSTLWPKLKIQNCCFNQLKDVKYLKECYDWNV